MVGDDERASLLRGLRARFEDHMGRHRELIWDDVQGRIEASPDKLRCLAWMEQTGGEPDVFDFDEETGEYLFVDFSPESPTGRRSLCYDQAALDARKANKPEGSAVGQARAMGLAMLTEAQYRHLQTLGEFDAKTSSWIETPAEVRTLGGALFGDRRFGRVFIYHNGAQSYYAARGFRGLLRV